MKTTTTTTGMSPRRTPRWFRLPWQLRVNVLRDASGIPANRHDARTQAHEAMPTSERAAHLRKERQYVADIHLDRWLRDQFRPLLDKANHLSRETWELALHFLTSAPTPEPINSREGLIELIREFPELDEKGARFYFAVRPNKQQRSSFDLDPEMAQRLGFARYLVQRGQYNEGFENDEAPPQYRTHFSDDDLRRKDN